tara:strand:+ start:1504 stop:1680 length:177 start_codon:yes stop_codon:yes gene_type:complete
VKKTRKNRVRNSRKKPVDKVPFGFDPTSPLTLHYISTGAILPDKSTSARVIAPKKNPV